MEQRKSNVRYCCIAFRRGHGTWSRSFYYHTITVKSVKYFPVSHPDWHPDILSFSFSPRIKIIKMLINNSVGSQINYVFLPCCCGCHDEDLWSCAGWWGLRIGKKYDAGDQKEYIFFVANSPNTINHLVMSWSLLAGNESEETNRLAERDQAPRLICIYSVDLRRLSETWSCFKEVFLLNHNNHNYN